MKKPLLFIILVSLFVSCEDKHKKDIETNIYYSKYLEIYNSYDSLGFDKTLVLLDEYISEFPNAQKAYIFKAWLLANNNKMSEIDEIFQEALKYDSSNVEIYIYWSALLLKDSLKINEAERINNIGFNFENNNLELLNNKAWIYLLKNKANEALILTNTILELDTNNNYKFYRTAAISALATKNDSLYSVYINSHSKILKDSLAIKTFIKENRLSLLYNTLK